MGQAPDWRLKMFIVVLVKKYNQFSGMASKTRPA
jgi:hypothetical protein